MPLTTVLFDLDGTLVDSNDLHVDAWSEVFGGAGHDVSRADIHRNIGKGGDNFVPSLLPDLDPARQEELARRHGELFKSRYLDRVRPFPGARDLVARVHAEGLAAVLASSAGGDELDHYVELLGIGDFIRATTSKDDVEHSKPDPDIFAGALNKVGAAPEDAVVIGDTPYDAIAARRCGIQAIGVLSGGFDEAELREAGASAIFRDVADLLGCYERSPLAG